MYLGTITARDLAFGACLQHNRIYFWFSSIGRLFKGRCGECLMSGLFVFIWRTEACILCYLKTYDSEPIVRLGLLTLNRPVCLGPGVKSGRPVFANAADWGVIRARNGIAVRAVLALGGRVKYK
jgi:hypothetical protein